MSHTVVLAPSARRDLIRLGDFLIDKNPRAALRAVSTIEAALRDLAVYPASHPLIGHGKRQLTIPFGQSGYIAQYRIQGRSVVVARIFHMRENLP